VKCSGLDRNYSYHQLFRDTLIVLISMAAALATFTASASAIATVPAGLCYLPTVVAAGSGRGKRQTKRSTADSSPSISISPALSDSSSWRPP
jgi:hypothetical protein